jgi:arylsulfatase A-like enzyme
LKSNILYIVIDSLRADKIFGVEKTSITPNIDNFIKNNVTFTNSFSCSDGTLSSMTSMFTSKFFFRTGVNIKNNYSLDEKTKNFVSELKIQGYNTIGLVPKISYLEQITKDFQNVDKTYDYYQNLSNGLGDKIIKKIKSFKNEPWFYYIHINDLHLPNWPSKEFDKEEFGSNRYERVVSQIDSWIGKIFLNIDKEKTIIVITADHGDFVHCIQVGDKIINFEPHSSQKFLRKISKKLPTIIRKNIGFYIFEKSEKQTNKRKVEKMNLTNSKKRALLNTRSQLDHFFYDELIHIPLIISSPKLQSQKIVNLVRTVDIFPTIMDLLKIKFEKDIDGQSLIPLTKGESLEEIPVYMERELMLKHSELDVCGIRTSKHKYFRAVSDHTKKIHLFDLKKDPLEENNIASIETKIVDKMEEDLRKIQRNTNYYDNNSSKKEDHDEKVKEELRKLGYL